MAGGEAVNARRADIAPGVNKGSPVVDHLTSRGHRDDGHFDDPISPRGEQAGRLHIDDSEERLHLQTLREEPHNTPSFQPRPPIENWMRPSVKHQCRASRRAVRTEMLLNWPHPVLLSTRSACL